MKSRKVPQGGKRPSLQARPGIEDALIPPYRTSSNSTQSTSSAFTARAGFAEDLPANLKSYVARLAQRPAYQRAAERTAS